MKLHTWKISSWRSLNALLLEAGMPKLNVLVSAERPEDWGEEFPQYKRADGGKVPGYTVYKEDADYEPGYGLGGYIRAVAPLGGAAAYQDAIVLARYGALDNGAMERIFKLYRHYTQ